MRAAVLVIGRLVLAVVVAVVVVGRVCSAARVEGNADSRLETRTHGGCWSKATRVERVKEAPLDQVLDADRDDLADLKEPLVHRQRAAGEWKLQGLSLEDALLPLTQTARAQMGSNVIHDVFVSTHSKQFMYAQSDKPLEKHVSWRQRYRTRPMVASEFVQALASSAPLPPPPAAAVFANASNSTASNKQGRDKAGSTTATHNDEAPGSHHSYHVYFSGNLSQAFLRPMGERFPPLVGIPWPETDATGAATQLPEPPTYRFPTVAPPSHSRFLWAGTPGVYTCFHFDDAHNVYTQVYGQKTFVLIPPAMYPHMYLFPRHHPSERQSQVDWYASLTCAQLDRVLEQFPAFAQISTVFTVTLNPGDVLFIPPAWFHHVTANTASVSINEWQQSASSHTLTRLFANALPFYSPSAGWPLDQLKLAIQGYLRGTLQRVIQLASRAQLLHLCPRSSGAEHGASHNMRRLRHCSSEVIDILLDRSFRPLALHTSPASLCSSGTSRNVDTFLQPFVEQTAAMFASGMTPQELPLYLPTWLQSLAALAVDARDVGAFLADCLQV